MGLAVWVFLDTQYVILIFGGFEMLTIREMELNDWERVSELDLRAFNSYYQKTGRALLVAGRTRTNLQAALAMNPGGCFVAGEDGLSGYIFSRAWGKLGWIGPFGVDPEGHGQGIGQKLLAAAVNQLKEMGCSTIGLETMPDSPYNVGLYARCGFNPVYSTLYLTKAPAAVSISLPFHVLSEVEEQAGLAQISALSQAVNPELDYAGEAKNGREHGWGETLLIGWPRPWAFAILRTVALRGEAAAPVCEVTSVVIEAGARKRLGKVLGLIENYAGQKQAKQITLPVNSVDADALQIALANGFRVGRVNLRMICQGEYPRRAGIDLSRWIT
jgi:ribosomal protein S18 acetylase RimI-like enzyme